MLLNGQNAKFYESPQLVSLWSTRTDRRTNMTKIRVMFCYRCQMDLKPSFFTFPSEKLKATTNIVISLHPSVGTVQLNSKCRDVLSISYVSISTIGDTFRFWFKSYKDINSKFDNSELSIVELPVHKI